MKRKNGEQKHIENRLSLGAQVIYLCSERRGTCWGKVFRSVSFENQYLYERADAAAAEAAENCSPAALSDALACLA